MAVTIEFRLSDRDYYKLRLLKRADKRSEITFNDYAEELLSDVLSRKYKRYLRTYSKKEANEIIEKALTLYFEQTENEE